MPDGPGMTFETAVEASDATTALRRTGLDRHGLLRALEHLDHHEESGPSRAPAPRVILVMTSQHVLPVRDLRQDDAEDQEEQEQCQNGLDDALSGRRAARYLGARERRKAARPAPARPGAGGSGVPMLWTVRA